MFRAELPAVFRVQWRHINLADIQQRTQRQRDDSPQAVRREKRQRHEVVTVQPLAASGSGRGIVMHAGALHMFAITFRGRVVDADLQSSAGTRIELPDDHGQHNSGDLPRLTADGDQTVVEAVPVVLNARGGEPRTGGASVVGEQHPGDDDRQSKGDAWIEHGLQRVDGGLQGSGQRHAWPSRLAASRIAACESFPLRGPGLLILLVSRLWPFRCTLTFRHPWLSRCGDVVTSSQHRGGPFLSPSPIPTAASAKGRSPNWTAPLSVLRCGLTAVLGRS